MSVKVELYLNDQQERDWFGELMNAIDHWRAQRPANVMPAVTPSEVVSNPASTPVPEAQVVAHIAPDPNGTEPIVTKPAAAKVTLAELEAVVGAYLNKHGVPATREKIASFGYPQLAKVPEEKYAELKAAFEGWMAE